MRITHKTIFALLVLNLVTLIQAKGNTLSDAVFNNFSTTDGLYHSYIRTIYQDNTGFVWLGTAEGLIKYDNKNFTCIRKENEGNKTLSANNIFCIYEVPKENTLWVGTQFGGINKIDTRTSEITNYLPDSSRNDNIDVIKSIVQLNRDLLIVGTNDNGLFKFIPSSKSYYKIKSIYLPDSIPYSVNQITLIKEEVYIASSLGVIKMDLNGQVTELINRPLIQSIERKQNGIVAFDLDKDGNIYFITPFEIWKYSSDRKFKLISKPEIENTTLTSIAIDMNSDIWYGTNGYGLHRLNQKDGKVSTYQTNQSSKYEIQDNTILSLSFSKQQPILWIGTKTGFTKLDLTVDKFKHINIEDIAGSNNVFLVYQDNDKDIWFWTSDGLFIKSLNSSNYKKIDLSLNEPASINCLLEYENHKFILATTKGLALYNKETHKTLQIKLNISDVDDRNLNIVTDMKQINPNIYLLSTFMGVVEFNIKTLTYSLYKLPDSKYVNGEFQFYNLLVSSDSSVWLGGREASLVKLDLRSRKYTFYASKQRTTGFKKSNFILGILEDKDKNLWLSTYGDGLLKFDTKSATFTKKFAINNLDNYTYSIVADTTGRFWITTNFGISHFNPKDGQTESYGLSDGTYSDEFNEGAFFTSKSGEIYFGGTNGITYFNPYKFSINEYIPPVIISKIKYGEDEIISTSITDSKNDSINLKKIVINQSKKNLIFSINVLNHCNAENNKIAWKLEGYETDWNYGSASDKIIYSNLPYGNYKLLTKGSNNDNKWNNSGESIDIDIIAPIYKTPFGWILFTIIIITSVSLFVYTKYNWQRIQKLRLEVLVKAKTADLEMANEELEINKIEILSQKAELEIHRKYLEETIRIRTAEFEKAKIKAEDSDKLKTAFLANLSHEIRTPMNAIVGFSSLLNTNIFSIKEQKEFVSLIMASSETLLVLIDDLLDISKIETSQITITNSPVHIGNFIYQLYQTLSIENNNPATTFTLNIDNELEDVEIITDHVRLKQIITNLVGNALKFTKEGFVQLTAKIEYYAILKNKGFVFKGPLPLEEEILFISVVDSGIGIEANDLEIIFEPFRKIENPKKEVFGGVGLGLSIVKKLALLLGGEIQVKSVPNEGSTFYFYIPLNSVTYKNIPQEDIEEA